MGEADTPQAMVRALYECLCGQAGQERNWKRFASLLHPAARLARRTIDSDGRCCLRIMSLDEYREDTRDYFRDHSFYETEVESRLERLEGIAHVFSSYESRHDPADPVPFMRGVNSIQLVHDGSRWQVLSVLWDSRRGAAG